MKSYIQIIASKTYETSPSVLVAFDSQKYLFNCGEGTQRLCAEKRIKFSKLGHLFTTRIGWDTCGGIPGFILGLTENQGIGNADRRVTSIHGPPNFLHFIASLRHFVRRSTLYIDVLETNKPYHTQKLGFPDENNNAENTKSKDDFIYKHPQGGKQNYGSLNDYYFQDENLKIKAIHINLNETFNEIKEEIIKDGSKRSLLISHDQSVEHIPPNKIRLTKDEAINNNEIEKNEIPKIGSNEFKLEVVKRMFASRDNIPLELKQKILSELIKRDNEVSTMVQERELTKKMFTELKRNQNNGSTNDNSEKYEQDIVNKMIEKEIDELYDSKRDHRLITPLPKIENNTDTIVCYICEGPKIKGKFHPELAKKLKVKKGKDYGKLYNGESVSNTDGEIIHPHQCMDPDRDGTKFIIIDVPSNKYVNPVMNNVAFNELYADGEEDKSKVACIIHFLGNEVAENPIYGRWTQRFGKDTQHIILSKKHCKKSILYNGFTQHITKLNVLDEKIFKLPYLETEEIKLIDEFQNYKIGSRLTTFHMEPKQYLDESLESAEKDFNPYDETEYKECFKDVDESYLEKSKLVKKRIENNDYRKHKDIKRADSLFVTTLGTGSAIPSRYRNVSSTLLYDEKEKLTILLDAGEGTYGQIYRRFELNNLDKNQDYKDCLKFNEFFQTLKIIFISHLHADHHLGLISLLIERQKLILSSSSNPHSIPKLFIIAPPQMKLWLIEFNQFEDLGMDSIHFISTEILRNKPQDNPYINQEEQSIVESHKKQYLAFGSTDPDDSFALQQLQTGLDIVVTAIPVVHSSYAHAFVFSVGKCSNDPVKIAYSGDCRPSKQLLAAAELCDVLIHEATFGGDECGSREARRRNHTTTAEALELAQQTQARTLVLTHFSQRFPKIPDVIELLQLLNLQEPSSNSGSETGLINHKRVYDGLVAVGFDLMTVQLGEIGRLELFLELFTLLYPDEVQGLDLIDDN